MDLDTLMHNGFRYDMLQQEYVQFWFHAVSGRPGPVQLVQKSLAQAGDEEEGCGQEVVHAAWREVFSPGGKPGDKNSRGTNEQKPR